MGKLVLRESFLTILMVFNMVEEDLDDVQLNYSVVQVTLLLDFSEESEKILELALSVAEELLDKNIFVEVEPIHVWFNQEYALQAIDLPQVYINGKLMFIGRVPNRSDFINAIMDRLGKSSKLIENEAIVVNESEDGFREVEVIY
ncbi:MAG: hypothetical protein QXY53_03205 [Desulfurococcaceae archaeon]